MNDRLYVNAHPFTRTGKPCDIFVLMAKSAMSQSVHSPHMPTEEDEAVVEASGTRVIVPSLNPLTVHAERPLEVWNMVAPRLEPSLKGIEDNAVGVRPVSMCSLTLSEGFATERASELTPHLPLLMSAVDLPLSSQT
jgi:hypothetical protein